MKVLHGLLTALALATGTRARPYPLESDDPIVTLTKTETVIPIPLLTSSTSTTSSSAPKTTFALAELTSSTESITAQPIMTLPPSVLDSSTSSFTGKCEYSFCNQGTNVCFYWAGVTSWDVSRGPLPGEIPTMLGPCETGLATTQRLML